MNSFDFTIGAIRATAIARLRELSLTPTPALDCDLLLAEVTGFDRAYLLAHGDSLLSEAQAAYFGEYLERAAGGEPIAYILGRRSFYDLEFVVTPDVLIPRPETELLLEQALRWTEIRGVVTAADVGTGSGALAVTFAFHRPLTRVIAIDQSEAALKVAMHNAAKNGLADRVHFLQGDLLEPVQAMGMKLNLVMANLPYIPTVEARSLPVSCYEPMLALDGGADGLDLIRRLLIQLNHVCAPQFLALLEFGAGQGEAILELARQSVPEAIAEILYDYAGHDRILRVENN
ncbi:MAG: peptide chain release factor N(5)-glutamine methyltransferase [Anaerolineae bacterium]|nr:peptide chain release factor N(5)-glutamine methyltransferase [Anaerolineae bacterium]